MSEEKPSTTPNGVEPLPGEAGLPSVAQSTRQKHTFKQYLALALVPIGLAMIGGAWVQRTFFVSAKPPDVESKAFSERPAAAGTEPRRLDVSGVAPSKSLAASAPAVPLVPAIVPTKDEAVDPIGVRRTSAPSSSSTAPQRVLPEDLPAVLMSGRSGSPGPNNAGRATQAPSPSADTDDAADSLEATKQNLQDYQRQLQKLLDDLTKTASGAASQPTSSFRPSARKGRTESRASSGSSGEGLFGGQLQSSATPRIEASTLGNRSLTLPKGTAFTCALKTKLISAASGFVSCQTQRNIYGDDGRVLLVERGSHIDGEYRNTSVHPGTVRIPVLWTRIRTPNGVTMNIESPGTGPLGESGVDGYVDNRWLERIGAAMLLSLVDDAVTLVGQKQSDGQSTVVLPATTANTDKLAEKVLDSTINIPPLIYNNQGGIVGIYVARDVDFSSVYALKAVQP